MYYEINVSEKVGQGHDKGRYKHLFATHPRSCTAYREAERVYEKLRRAFPEPEYNISVTRWEEKGEAVHFAQGGEG